MGSNIYWKKTSQTVTIDKDDCAFSVVYSLLKIKSKAYVFENIFEIFKWQNKCLANADVSQKDCFNIFLKYSRILESFLVMPYPWMFHSKDYKQLK